MLANVAVSQARRSAVSSNPPIFACFARANWPNARVCRVNAWKTATSAVAIAESIGGSRAEAQSAVRPNARRLFGFAASWRRGLPSRLARLGHDLFFLVQPALRLLPKLGDCLARRRSRGE